MLIDGLKLIFKTGSVDIADDPLLPWRLEARFRPEEFMQVAFLTLYGGEERLVVRGQTREALDKLVEINNLRGHPRLKRLTIVGPDGASELAGAQAGGETS